MIWFVIGVIPVVLVVLWALVTDPRSTLITAAIVGILLGLVISSMYGMWQMGWINQCGGDTFWTSDDCS